MFFKQVIGHQQIKETLIESVKRDQISHAQLFAGNEGYGTLALAIAYAQYIHCTDKQDNDSCGVCPSCRKMEKLSHPDLHFVFPVVKTGSKDVISDDYITEFRKYLLETNYPSVAEWSNRMSGDGKSGLIYTAESDSIIHKLSLKPYESVHKIMIIWAPEKMHDTCSNKLLKTLEEPSPNTLIILVAADPNEIITTILSRTQRIKLLPLTVEDITNALMSEAYIPRSEAEVYAKLANGSYIRALEMSSQTEEKNYFFDSFSTIMRLAYGRDIAKMYEWVEGFAKNSRDVQKNFLLYSLSMIRENFILNFQEKDIVYLAPKEDQFSQKFHPFVNERNVSALMEEVNLAYAHIEQNGSGKIVLFDMALKFAAVLRA